VYEFDVRSKLAKMGITDPGFTRAVDFDVEIYHLIATEFIRLENEEMKRMNKKRGKG